MRTKANMLGVGGVLFCSLAVVGLGITVLSVTRRQLYNQDSYCDESGSMMDDCYNSDTICWIAESPLDDMVPCNYLFTTGAIGLCLQVLIGLLPCWTYMLATVAMSTCGVLSVAWWLVSAIYFTKQVDSIDDSQPADYWRNVMMGVLWAAFSMCVLQLLAMVVAAKTGRDVPPALVAEAKDVEAAKGADKPATEPSNKGQENPLAAPPAEPAPAPAAAPAAAPVDAAPLAA